MTLDRIAIKQQLLLERSVLRGGKSVVLCDLCGKPGATDLHELLVERDDVKGAALMRRITESPENLQLLHNQCNMVGAKTTAGREKLIRAQIERFGRAWLQRTLPRAAREHTEWQRKRLVAVHGTGELVEWIEGLGLAAPDPYIRRVISIGDAMIEEIDREYTQEHP